MYTYKNSFFTVLLWGGWLIANIKLQKSLLVGHTVAHVVKKRETRYDKEKARLKVVLFLSVPPPRLLLPAFEVGKNFKRLLLCSRSPPFFAIMPPPSLSWKSFQSSWLFSVKFENNTQTISSFMKFFNRLACPRAFSFSIFPKSLLAA